MSRQVIKISPKSKKPEFDIKVLSECGLELLFDVDIPTEDIVNHCNTLDVTNVQISLYRDVEPDYAIWVVNNFENVNEYIKYIR